MRSQEVLNVFLLNYRLHLHVTLPLVLKTLLKYPYMYLRQGFSEQPGTRCMYQADIKLTATSCFCFPRAGLKTQVHCHARLTVHIFKSNDETGSPVVWLIVRYLWLLAGKLLPFLLMSLTKEKAGDRLKYHTSWNPLVSMWPSDASKVGFLIPFPSMFICGGCHKSTIARRGCLNSRNALSMVLENGIWRPRC